MNKYPLDMPEEELKINVGNDYFPNFDKNNFNKEILATNEEKGIKYQMCLYRKKV